VTRVDDLLRDLRGHLGASVSYTTASAANDVYEGFLFSLVVATARRSGAAIHYEDVRGNKTHSLVFRTSPGRIYSTRNNYTHAVVEFGTAPTLETHVGIFVQGSSGVEHECDVAVLDADEAALCRREKTTPRASKCLLAIECKYVLREAAERAAGMAALVEGTAHRRERRRWSYGELLADSEWSRVPCWAGSPLGFSDGAAA
jgi:hypothetical protein